MQKVLVLYEEETETGKEKEQEKRKKKKFQNLSNVPQRPDDAHNYWLHGC
jgi:hypothetical protein